MTCLIVGWIAFDAIAITSVIDLPLELHENYYNLVDESSEPMGWC